MTTSEKTLRKENAYDQNKKFKKKEKTAYEGLKLTIRSEYYDWRNTMIILSPKVR